MSAGLNIWDYLTRLVILLLFIVGLLAVAVWYLPLIRQNERMRQAILHDDLLIQKEEETSRQLQYTKDALLHDQRAIERLARERLGYAKPGETVIRFESASTNSARF